MVQAHRQAGCPNWSGRGLRILGQVQSAHENDEENQSAIGWRTVDRGYSRAVERRGGEKRKLEESRRRLVVGCVAVDFHEPRDEVEDLLLPIRAQSNPAHHAVGNSPVPKFNALDFIHKDSPTGIDECRDLAEALVVTWFRPKK